VIGRGLRLALTLPGLLYLGAFLLVPCSLVLVLGAFERGIYGGIDWSVRGTANLVRALDPLYLGILVTSARIAATATGVALLLAYPAAYAIALSPRRWQPVLLVLVTLPFWSNYLIRTYAWIVLLNREGLINRLLAWLGWTGEPLPLLYNEFAVVTGLVYNYVPFVVLAIYASVSRLDPRLREASADLGARPWTTFRHVTLPLTLPGVAVGAVFVFVLSIGNFVTPDLLGGGRLQMVGNLIYDQFLTARDWPFGATLAAILILVMLTLLALQARFAARERLP
jgi:spermidine/putrescine transport system permease protein